MQFCKVLSYKLRVFNIIYNILPFLCIETPLQQVPFGLYNRIRRPKNYSALEAYYSCKQKP